jgi:hypothetical protein
LQATKYRALSIFRPAQPPRRSIVPLSGADLSICRRLIYDEPTSNLGR